MARLSVVLISKNQVWNIPRLVESVLREAAGVPSTEVVLVDSASSDGTAEAAAAYPIGVLRLRGDQPLTPAAGRYVGYSRTMGDLVLFLDGDMELAPGWLERALRVLEERPEVGVVSGQIVDLPKAAGPEDKPPLDRSGENAGREVRQPGGAALYRRSVLVETGTFNPYLCSEEEPELCLRVRHAGYRVLQLRHPIAYHYSDPSWAISTLVGRWKRNLYLGGGQALRYHLGSPSLWPYLRERGFGLVPALGVGAGLVSLLASLVSGRWTWFGSWLLTALGVVSVDAYRKRSLYRTGHSLLLRLLIVDGMVRGFLAKPLEPDGYPARVEVIKPVGTATADAEAAGDGDAASAGRERRVLARRGETPL